MTSDYLGNERLKLGVEVYLGSWCDFASPKEQTIAAFRSDARNHVKDVSIGNRSILQNHVIVYEGTHIGEEVVVEDRVRIGYDCNIGSHTRLMYGAYICDRVNIGDRARVAGFVCDAARIEKGSTVLGNLVHEYSVHDGNWWGVDEPPPIILEDSVVGYGATVVGPAEIGPHSYIAAGAIVTRNVPAYHICVGTNKHIPCEEWSGERLQKLISVWSQARQ